MAAYTAVTATAGAVKTLVGVWDSAFNDSLLAQLASDKKQLMGMLHQSGSNIELLENHKDVSEPDKEYIREAMEQFRLRAEALNGLGYLLILAAVKSNTDEEYKTISQNRYKIKEYIENYILNDQWVYRANATFAQRHRLDFLIRNETTFIPNNCYATGPQYCATQMPQNNRTFTGGLYNFNLGLYWSHITSSENKGSLRYWGLDDNYRLMQPNDNSVKDELIYGTPLPTIRKDTPAGHLKANFQGVFPIHQLNEPDFNELMQNFRINWGDLRQSDFHFIGIFKLSIETYEVPLEPQILNSTSTDPLSDVKKYRELSEFDFDNLLNPQHIQEEDRVLKVKNIKWVKVNPKPWTEKRHGRSRFKTWQDNEQVHHDTPISIVIVLKEGVNYHIPVSAQVLREDVGFADIGTLKGPSYEDVCK